MHEVPQPVGKSKRLKLQHVERERLDEFTCRARVVLLDPEGTSYEGRAELPVNEQNLLRVVAQATIQAVAGFLQQGVDMRLVGLRSLRIFDTAVVAVQVGARTAGRQKLLLGIALADEDPAGGCARAVLHATNRLLGNFIDR